MIRCAGSSGANEYKYQHLFPQSTITKELTRVNERVKGSDHLKPLKPPEDEDVQLVAVAVALICICIQQSSATFAEIRELQELQEAVNNDSPAAEHQEVSADSWLMPYHIQKHGIKCRFCCGCCNSGVCGLCCRF
ncbi:hepcidin-like [Oreochromis aureus]|uniref:hepcidin-like n=1 Tax=Oreochromis aureus TaxID=47969 RepID=UPI001954C2CD|nr:hepcidin-like [Oreochromis aureus]